MATLTKQKKRPVHLRMPADLFSIIDSEAKKAGKTFTDIIVIGLNRGLEGKKKRLSTLSQ